MDHSRSSSVTNDLQRRLKGGLIPAVPVPFDADGNFHARVQDSYLRYMSSQTIAGVAVWAHTGRGLLLDPETARRVIDDWRGALSDKVLIAGVGATSKQSDAQHATTLTLKMAEAAAKHGADALLAYPPSWLRNHHASETLIVEHHARLAELGLPIVIFYLYEAAGGIRYSAAVLDELLSLPHVVGIKVATLDSVMTYQDIAQQVQTQHPDMLLITGEDRFLGYSFQRGASAALIGLGAVCSELQSELIAAHFNQNAAHFLELSKAVDRLAEAIFVNPMEGYIQRILWALAHLGVLPLEGAYDPWAPAAHSAEFENIGRVVSSLTACTS